jgi:hypothetical protein
LEEEVVKEFENIEKELGKVNWRNDILKASDYVEKWRVMLWDKAFFTLMRAVPSFSKGTKFLDFSFEWITMKKILYMLFKF